MFRCEKSSNWGYCEVKGLVEIWADEEIQPQFSVMSRKQNIWEDINENLMTNATSTINRINYTTMHETCLKPTSDVDNAITSTLRRNMLP